MIGNVVDGSWNVVDRVGFLIGHFDVELGFYGDEKFDHVEAVEIEVLSK